MYNLLFSPFGTINRLPFFLGLIASIFMLWAAIALYFFPTYFLMHEEFQHWTIVMIIFSYAVGLTFGMGSLWSAICLHVKRLTDLKLPFYLVLIPFACGTAEGYLIGTPYNIVAHVISLIYFGGLLFWPSRVN